MRARKATPSRAAAPRPKGVVGYGRKPPPPPVRGLGLPETRGRQKAKRGVLGRALDRLWGRA